MIGLCATTGCTAGRPHADGRARPIQKSRPRRRTSYGDQTPILLRVQPKVGAAPSVRHQLDERQVDHDTYPAGSVRGAPALLGRRPLAAILAVAGCAAGVSNNSTQPSTTTAETTTASAAVTSAGSGEVVPVASPQTVLAVWDAALTASTTPPLVITAPLNGQIGSWEGPIGGNNKQALLGGQVRPGSDVTAQPRPAEQTITWANGQHRTIPAIPAAAAIAALVADGANSSCGGCDPATALTLHDPN